MNRNEHCGIFCMLIAGSVQNLWMSDPLNKAYCRRYMSMHLKPPGIMNHHLVFVAWLAAPLAACHTDVSVNETESAGDPKDNLTDSGADAPDDPDFEPLDFCAGHPDEDFEGSAHHCEGDFSSTIRFDYFGDPDLGIDALLVCIDFSEFKEEEPGYVFTCFAQVQDLPFWTEGIDVDACCVEDAPDGAVFPLCRIDAAEEICAASADKLNELRKQIPFLPKFAEIHHQLLNLNEHIATAAMQMSCASELADGFVQAGNINGYMDTVDWAPGDNNDPDTGWPSLRNLDLNVTSFHIDDFVDTGTECGAGGPSSILGGTLAESQLTVEGLLGKGQAIANGRFVLAADECAATRCPAELRALEITIPALDLGIVQVSELRARLAQPARGWMKGGELRIPGHALKWIVEGRARAISNLTIGGVDVGSLFDGSPSRISLRASDDLVAAIDSSGQLRIAEHRLDVWPVTARLGPPRR